MRSATSYFNATLYRKTMARFWPLWAVYGVIWGFLIPLNFLSLYFNRFRVSDPVPRLLRQALDLPELATPGLYLAAIFAVLCAMAVFGYLYNSRSACWTHALPLRRETLFTTQYLAGLSFLLLPQAAVAVLAAIVEVAFLPSGDWGQALGALLAWLAAQCGLCLFFFSFAAFCAMFTGHILALPAFYGILNLLAAVIYSLVEALMREFFFGYAGNAGVERIMNYLSPVYALQEAVGAYRYYEDALHYFPYFNSPGTIAAYAAVGVVLAVAALYVYRRRHVESAGDVVAVPLVRPLFKYGVSFCSGLCLGLFTSIFFGWSGDGMAILTVCILLWTVIGYFAAEMLLRKSFRVFRHWKGALVMPVLLLALCLACSTDLFGVETRVPAADDIETLSVSLRTGYPDDNGRHYAAALTDPDSIQRFMELHQAVVDDLDRLDSNSSLYDSRNDYTYFDLRYTLKGGGTVYRRYDSLPLYREDLDREGSFTNRFRQLCQDRELIAQAYGFEDFLKQGRLTGAWLSRLNDASGGLSYNEVYVDDYARELWDAVQADYAEGTIGVRYLFDFDEERSANTYYTDLTFGVSVYQNPDGAYSDWSVRAYAAVEYAETRSVDYTLTITLTPQARHTLAVLEKTGIYEQGYSLASREPYAIDSGYPTMVY